MSDIKKEVGLIINKAIKKGVFPGAAAGITFGVGGKRKKTVLVQGDSAVYPEKTALSKEFFFDLASLTKPLATTLTLLCLIKQKKINLADCLAVFFNEAVPADKKNITIYHLLGHTSGLPAYQPYYKNLCIFPEPLRKQKLLELVLKEPLAGSTGGVSRYSDLGFMLLGFIIEKVVGKPLNQAVEEMVFNPLGLNGDLFFNPLKSPKKDKQYVATEKCPWRKKLIVGEVHDDNAWAVGGVAGHAGLFGNIEGVLTLTTELLDQWHGRSKHSEYDNRDLKKFLARQKKGSNWGLGFDKPTPGGSSSGRYFSEQSFGHLGFTGTSFWVDPLKELVVVLLSNRVHPDRDNEKIRLFRPRFHDTIVETLL